MKKIFYIWCMCCIAWHQMNGQSLQISGSKVQLPPGDVLGAAFYEDKGMFFVQQSVSSMENGESIRRYHRQLSSWNLSSHAMITQSALGEIHGAFSDPCGRVQVSTTTRRVYVCSAESHLESMDPDTLETAGTMAHVDGQVIIDFAVDDLNGRVLVLSAQKDKSILLTSYSLLTGEKQQETALPVINRERIGAPLDLVSVSRSGQIGVYLEDKNGSLLKTNSGIYMCKDAPALACAKASDAAETDWVSAMSFLGQDILAASSRLADDRWQCIMSVSPGYTYSLKKPLWLGVTSLYCARGITSYNSRGVHYAVGVVEDKYVVGFTGADKIDFLSGFDKPVSTSFSVWRAGSSKAAAVVKLPSDYGVQRAYRIVASNTEPLFIAYHGMSNTLYLYSIADR